MLSIVDSYSVICVVLKSDGDTGGGGDWWGDRYWCWVTGNAVISLTPSLTDIYVHCSKISCKINS